MASVIALRAVLGASLGLGTVDLVWINLALAPRVVGQAPAPADVPAPQQRVADATPRPAEVPAPVAPAPAVPEPAVPIVEPVYFATRSAVLDAGARRTLTTLVERAAPGAEFVLEGHADYRGDEGSNRTLSKQRALATARFLEELGVDRSRIRVGYVGEDQSTASRELWRDRRVDIQINGGS
jgi:outer membrane protein OmpA-like peptidoglycan-associated protein